MSRLDNIINYAKDSYQVFLDNESVSPEAEVLSALLRSKGYIRGSTLPTHALTNEFNAVRESHERFKTNQVGRIMSRLGFRTRRTQDGRSGWYIDSKLLSRLCSRYGIAVETTL